MKRILSPYLFAACCMLSLLPACKSAQQTAATPASPSTVQTTTSKAGKAIDTAAVERNFIDGCKYVALGEYEKAIFHFKEVLKVDPDNAPTYFELAKIYYQAGQVLDALNYARRSAEIEPDNIYFQLLYADVLTYAAYYDNATKTYRKIIELDPRHVDAYFQLATIYEKQGDYASALAVFESMHPYFVDDEQVLLEEQRLYVLLNQPEKATEVLLKLHEINPEAPQYLYMLTELYEMMGKIPEATQTFQELLQMDPNNPDLQFKRAELQKASGETGAYFETMRNIFANPNGNIDKKIFYLIPYVDSIDRKSFRLKDTVLIWAQLLTQAHPEDGKSYAMRGDFLFYLTELEEARVCYRRSIDIRSDVYDVWIKLFYIDSDLRMYDSLKETTDQAMELYPNQPLGYYFNGVALANLDENEAAVKVLKRGLPLAVSNVKLKADMYTMLGDAYHSLMNHAESDKAFDNSLQLNPDNPYALNNYAYYLSVRNEHLDKAEAMSKRSLELAPNEPSLEDTYAWILFQNEKYNDAKKWLEKAIEHGGGKSGIIVEHCGDVWFKLGNIEKALENWQKAKSLGGGSDMLDKKINDKMYYE